MEREPVRSRALSSIGYDPDAQVLEVEFQTGKIYRYLGVPADLHAWLMRSPGKGGLFNRLVEVKFEFQRVLDPPAAEGPSLEDALKASLAGVEESEPEGSGSKARGNKTFGAQAPGRSTRDFESDSCHGPSFGPVA